ncbi:hypothetical protein P691DRAFT_787851 [Macrolepiota fuliginosa MF-IS2]|uniref:DUF6697 domain-containing protein n=1 Tax=Macrolepiota fuliginosa MF-IS2 TaxID=1400762 RepID=A0A9P5X4Q1_9AGAR|nr:hypothetical protein P691DRAFT_787851 [Macrolepiota fuliginosa MF-IS2]
MDDTDHNKSMRDRFQEEKAALRMTIYELEVEKDRLRCENTDLRMEVKALKIALARSRGAKYLQTKPCTIEIIEINSDFVTQQRDSQMSKKRKIFSQDSVDLEVPQGAGSSSLVGKVGQTQPSTAAGSGVSASQRGQAPVLSESGHPGGPPPSLTSVDKPELLSKYLNGRPMSLNIEPPPLDVCVPRKFLTETYGTDAVRVLSNKVIGEMAPDEYKAHKFEVKKKWAEELIKSKSYPGHVATRARISLRKEGESLSEENIQREKRRSGAVTIDIKDVILAFEKGEEKLQIVATRCVGYDHSFAKELKTKSVAWAKGSKAKPVSSVDHL